LVTSIESGGGETIVQDFNHYTQYQEYDNTTSTNLFVNFPLISVGQNDFLHN